MTPERWTKIRQIFEDVLARSPEERDAFVAAACSGDQELRREIEKMLAEDTSDGGFLDRPLWNAAPPALPKIGHYRIIGVLGEGGMGTVYEAEQEQPRRIVALKVIRPGWASSELLRRFEQESQALARLQHPGIAQIYEAGTADSGLGPQPYFAMEFIRGRTLREYAEASGLTTRQRLDLMIKICEAVDHAHQRGIIHRDLKPGNILVDETGQPKILDFGVARIADSEAQVTRQTDLGQLVGTLAYMSPEQVTADPFSLDTRSDVYSLGVILYELLAGQPPYQLSLKLHEAVRTIQEKDPAPLSSVRAVFRGDIETIVAKALEKDKERRYGSAAALAQDIARYSRDEPILARPASAAYQLRKFARRNRALVAGVASVFIVLLGGVVASTREAMRANRASVQATLGRDRALQAEQVAGQERDRALRAEETATAERNRAIQAEARALEQRNRALAEKQRADQESATVQAVNDFLRNDILAQASASTQARPQTKPDPDLKVRTALDRAAARISDKFGRQPLVEASIRQTIATTYEELGLYPQAQQQVERALALRRGALGGEHADTLASMSSLGSQYVHQGKYAQAESLLNEVMAVQTRVLGDRHPNTLASMSTLAIVLNKEGKHDQAEPLAQKVLSIRRRVRGPSHPDTLESMSNLAVLYIEQRKYDRAESMLVEVLDLQRRVLSEDHPDFLTNIGNLAIVYSRQKKYVQAEVLLSKAVGIQQRVLGEDHPLTLTSRANLALAYVYQRKYAQAEPLYTGTLQTMRRVLGEEHRETLTTLAGLATLYSLQGRFAEAEPLFARIVDVEQRILGAGHPDTLANLNNLATLYQYEGKYQQAESLLARVVEIARRALGEENPATLGSLSRLVTVLRRQRKYPQAEPLLSKLLETRRRVLGEEHPDTRAGMLLLGEAKLEQQKFADAELLFRDAVRRYEKASAQGWERYHGQCLLGASLAGQQKYAEAEPLLLSGYQGMHSQEGSIPSESRPNVRQAGERIVQLYQAWNKPEQAAEWRATIQQK